MSRSSTVATTASLLALAATVLATSAAAHGRWRSPTLGNDSPLTEPIYTIDLGWMRCGSLFDPDVVVLMLAAPDLAAPDRGRFVAAVTQCPGVQLNLRRPFGTTTALTKDVRFVGEILITDTTKLERIRAAVTRFVEVRPRIALQTIGETTGNAGPVAIGTVATMDEVKATLDTLGRVLRTITGQGGCDTSRSDARLRKPFGGWSRGIGGVIRPQQLKDSVNRQIPVLHSPPNRPIPWLQCGAHRGQYQLIARVVLVTPAS
jgi:hypothetical protein